MNGRPIVIVIGNPNDPRMQGLAHLPDQYHWEIHTDPNSVIAFVHRQRVQPTGRIVGMLAWWSHRALVDPIVEHCPEIPWLHCSAVGVDHLFSPVIANSNVVFTCGRGLYTRVLAEWVIGSVWFFNKRIAEMRKAQAQGVWRRLEVDEIHGKTLGIIGYGGIGKAVAHMCQGIGMKVKVLRRTKTEPLPEYTNITDADDLLSLCAEADYLVVAAPLTKSTLHMVGEEQLRAMRPSSVLINIARGPLVHEASLIMALEQKWIAGAALDVFDVEPLPAGHPFYAMENVLLSAHCADWTVRWLPDALERFLDNLARIESSRSLLGTVNKSLGY